MWTEQLPSGRVRGGFKHPATGRKIQRTFDYAYEAESWAIAAEGAAQAGREEPPAAPADPSPAAPVIAPQIASSTCPTVGAYAARFLDARRGHVSVSTWGGYEIQLRLGVLADPSSPRPGSTT